MGASLHKCECGYEWVKRPSNGSPQRCPKCRTLVPALEQWHVSYQN